MAKIISFPTLCEMTEHEKNDLAIQVLELREKMNNVVNLMCDQEETEDLRHRLYNEIMTIQSMLTNADELLRSAYSRKK